MPDQMVVPHLYLDTGVLVDVIRDIGDSFKLLGLARKKQWVISTSSFAVMEMLDIEQEDAFFRVKVAQGMTARWAMRNRTKRDLPKNELADIYKRIRDKLAALYDFIDYWELTPAGLDEAVKFAKESNISAPDCIHLATATEAGCDLLVTTDEFFREEAKQYLPTSLPKRVEKELRSLDFML